MPRKDDHKAVDEPIDLAARIGSRAGAPPPPPPPAQPDQNALPPRLDGPLPPRRESRPGMIGADEPAPAPIRPAAPGPEAEEDAPREAAIVSPRTAPAPGEIDLVITPLPTPDDWHRFELALRRVRGVGTVKTEYYRHGVLKVRVAYTGGDRLGNALRAGVPGYRIRVIGEDRTTLQILVAGESEERRPG